MKDEGKKETMKEGKLSPKAEKMEAGKDKAFVPFKKTKGKGRRPTADGSMVV